MFDNYISINKKFKSSVNLEIDLMNEDKIEQYIPTTDLCDVMKKYLKGVISLVEFRSTLLSGPYGKGKSYLMLMILYLLYKHDNRKTFNLVCKKIKRIDEELYKLLVEYDAKGEYLVPVLINNNKYDDFNKNFLIALSMALETFGFNDIVPNTSYLEALKCIDTWKTKSSKGFDLLGECIDSIGINIDDLISGLRSYNKEAFNKFTKLYNCVSHGLEFFSMTSDDIVSVYTDVIVEMSKQDPKFKGLFIVYDEFGTFINNQTNDFQIRLNKLQQLAEKCNNTNEKMQMHLCCILHKDIQLYKVEKQYTDAFEAISGRFESIRFNRSLEENYQVLCSALEKKENYNELLEKLKKENKELINTISKSNIFTKNQFEFVVNNGLPFNPSSLYSLIQVSEKIAQNERTLFTFLSDKDIYGFRYFLANNDKKLLNSDNIYDYFESTIKDNSEYKMLYYKVESLKKSNLKSEEHSIFKAIAIIKIINDDYKLSCNASNIAMMLGLKFDETIKMVNSLIDRNVLKKNINDDSIDFAVIADDELNKMLENIIVTKYSKIDLGMELTKFDSNKYYYSNEYNFKHKMVRFYKSIYLEASTFKKLSKLDSLYKSSCEQDFCDGLIINLINDGVIDKNYINKILTKNSSNIIIRYSKNNISKSAIIKVQSCLAAQYLMITKNDLSDIVRKSLPLLIDDLKEEINQYLLDYNNNSISLNKLGNGKNLKEIIKCSFENYYSLTIKYNNEQVNKNVISNVTQKARNTVIDSILNQDNQDFGPTSQEATIKNSFLNAEKNGVLEIIKNYFVSCEKKTKLSDLIYTLQNAPYGMRNGIIPIFIAQVISNLSLNSSSCVDTILLYNESQEIEMNATNLAKACLNSSKYYFRYTQINKEKLFVTEELLNLFSCKKTDSFSANIKNLIFAIKSYVSNLAPIIIKSSSRDNLLSINDKSMNFKNMLMKFDSNNYDLLFNGIPEVLECTYNELPKVIKEEIIDYYANKINELQKNVISRTKSLFGHGDGALKSIIENWKNTFNYFDDIIYEKDQIGIYNAMKNIKFNEGDAINQLSFGAINCAIEDWNVSKADLFFKRMIDFIQVVTKYDHSKSISKKEIDVDKNNITLSSLGNTLFTNIMNSIEEYGSSISNEETAKVLKKILGEILK